MHAKLLLDPIQEGAHHVPEISGKKAVQLVPPHRVAGTFEDMFVFLHVIHDEGNGLLIVHQQVEMLDYLDGLLFQHPLQKVIDALEMIVEGVAVDIARLDQLAHGDLRDDFGLKLLLQCGGKLSLGPIGLFRMCHGSTSCVWFQWIYDTSV